MDRKTLLTLVAVTVAFIFFTSDTWHKLVRRTLGLPDPPVVEEVVDSTRTANPSDTSTPRLSEAPADSSEAALASVADSTPSDSGVTVRSFVVRTPHYRLSLSNKGGRIESVQLLGVTSHSGAFPEMLPGGRGGILGLEIDGQDLSGKVFAMEGAEGDSIVVGPGDSAEIRLIWSQGGKAVGRRFRFDGTDGGIRSWTSLRGWEKPAMRMSWNTGLLQVDSSAMKIPFGPPHFNNLVWRDAEEVSSHSDNKSVSASGPLQWVGLRGQYLMGAVLFDSLREGELDADTVLGVDGQEEKSYAWRFRWRPQAGVDSFTLVVTPLEVGALKAWDASFEKVLFNGWAWFFRADLWFPKLCLFVLGLLNFFHKLLPNYGIAIILLTLVARLAVFPLTLKQVRQSKRMAVVMPAIKPKIDALKEKYKNDPRKLQEETLRIYNENGVNPLATMAGCLPLLLQMPVFFALYMVLGRAIELRGAPFFGWISDLAQPDVILPMVKIPLIFPLGITVLPLFMAGSLYLLNKLTIKDPQQQALVYMMPVMMLVFSGSFPSGLVLYWTVSNLFSVGQTWLVNAGPAATAAPEVGGTPKRKGSSKHKH
ncbi:MAG: membrane protein insertase YidC [Fibrobacteria bacterium]|nr:membrane protein insertase YidC [Fibrobacteria bacterium]